MPDAPAEERFIAAATAPLADNAELHLASQQLLLAEGLAGGDAEVVAAAAGQLERAGSGGWRMLLWAVAGVAMLGALVFAHSEWKGYSGVSALGLKFPGVKERAFTFESTIGPKLNPQQRLLLLGDTSRGTLQAEHMLALHESDPAKVEYYVDYVLAYCSEHKSLPPDFLETGKRIDPGNAWFPAYASGVLVESTAMALPQTAAEKKAKLPRNYSAKDPAKVAEARELFHQAARLPSFDLRQAELIRRRVELLPKRTRAFDHVQAATYMAGMRAASLPLRDLPKLINIECTRLVAENDREGLAELVADWDAFMALYAPSADATLIDALVKSAMVRVSYRDLANAAGKLGLTADAERLRAVAGRLDAYRDEKKAANEASAVARQDLHREMSMLGGIAMDTPQRQVMNPPELRSRLAPGRQAEHEFMLKFCTLILLCPVLLLVGLCLALFRFRADVVRRQLSARLVQVLGVRDWTLLLGGGVVIPFVLFQVVARLPWTGGREWGVGSMKYLVPTMALNLTAWLMVLLSMVIARHLFRKRLGFLGLRWRFAWVAYLLSLLLALAIPLAGQAFLPWAFNWQMPVVYTVFMTTQAWVLTAAIRGLFSRSENLLKRLLLCRALLPGIAVAVILAVLSLPLADHLEGYWAQRDEVNEISPEAPSLTRYEWEVTQIAHKEILEVLQLPER